MRLCECGASLEPYDSRRKFCDECRKLRNKASKNRHRKRNPEAEKEARRKYWERRGGDCVKKAESRKRTLKAKGLSVEQYDQLLSDQGGICAICGGPQTSYSRLFFDIDHDHECCPGAKTCGKCIRGLLCHPCNMGLGAFRDKPETLQAAIEYLQKRRP
jgi:Recombination endonuclease VII